MKVGLLLPGDKNSSKESSRLKHLFEHLDKKGIDSLLIPYSYENINEIEPELKKVDIVMVWVNPIQNGKNREDLDAMLRRVADAEVFVSTHPDTILSMGTKDVLHTTREMEWGGDIYIYKSNEELRAQLMSNLRKGSRVLKQYRGNGGIGIWRVELIDDNNLRVLHALRDSVEQRMQLDEFYQLMSQYEIMIDQPFISPLPDGMVRAYMSQNKVVGFGHQYVTALIWPPNPDEPIYPEPRLYYPKTKAEYQKLRVILEEKWIPEMQRMLDIATDKLPLLWDADFLINDSYKLCEINVSSVYPYPEYATEDIIDTILNMNK